jgi:predicted nucleic acid-binding protein
LLDRSRGWLETVNASSVSDPILAGLDAGEKEAIGLAVSMNADLILLDEARGRRAASATESRKRTEDLLLCHRGAK